MGALLTIPLSVYPYAKAKATLAKLTFSLIFLLFFTYNEAFANPAGYLYRVKITIAPSSGCGGGNLNDFPVLIEQTAPVLRSIANGGVINNANGYDVVFTAANGNTLLDFQLDHYNAATGTYAAWVRMNNFSLSGTTDIYMYYGNSAVTTNQSTTNTWNASFATVYHFQSNSFLDGTVNTVNGTNTGTTDAAAAKIGGGRSFNGTTDYIQSSTSTVLKTANNLTISTWFRANSTNPAHMLYQGQPLGSDGQNGWGDGTASTDGQELNISTGTCCGATGGYVSAFLGHTDEQQNANVLLGQEVFTNTTDWHFLVATMSSINSGGTPTVNLYLDGALVDTNTGTALTLPRTNMNDFFTIGRPFANSRFFNGELDEVRIADTDRGLDWICAEYNNQNNPGSWLTFTNVAPVLGSMESPALNFTEDAAPIIITASTTITDENDGYMNGAAIQFTANYTSTEDVLAFTNANGITGSWNAGTGVLTLSGTATAANYLSAIRSITYQNTNTGNPSIAVRTVTFSVTDANGALSNTVSRNIGVTPVNDAPVLANTEGTALAYSEGQVATIVTPLTTVTDVDNTTLTGATVRISAGYLNTEDVLAFTNTPNITGTWTAATGILTLTGTTTVANYQSAIQSITYQNTNNSTPSTTTRTVSFQVNDGAALSNITTRNITVTAVNDAPVAVNDAYSTSEDTPLAVAVANRVLLNDTDVEGNTLTAVLDVGPANGTLTLNTNGTFTYTPAANFNGSDSFTYHANDGAANSNIVTVTITVSPVNDAPVAVNNTYTTNEDIPLTVVLANGVLTNDTDIDPNPLTAALVTGPAQGTLTLNADGTFTYTPGANYNGSDSFTYHANDGTVNSNDATVTITINAVNDLPVAVNNAYSTNEDTPLTVALANSVLVNDTDLEGSTLTAVLDAGPANGTLTLNADGTFTYTPAANYNGGDSFTYHANDGTGNSNIAMVTITINAVNDAPVAVNNAYTTNEDAPLTVALANSVLVNDTDLEGSTLTAVLDAGPANGTLTLNADGTFTYTPAANYNGGDSFTYHANDGPGNSNIATVTITINAVNDAPVAVNNAYTTNEDTPITVVLANSVLVNDTDTEGNALTAVLNVGPANGTLTLNANGTFIYTPTANYNGSDSFTYHANDGTGNSNIATVTITINAVNDAPVAVNNAYTTNEDAPLTVVLANSVLVNDTDAEGNALTAVLDVGPANGTLTLNTNGTFTYTPAANFNGSDSFTYHANDGTGNSNIATVTITINAVNDAPVAVNNAYTTNEDAPLTVVLANSVLVNDTDAEGNALTAVLDVGPANGTLTLNANGTFTYTPAANYNGSDTFTYHANDGTGNSNVATVTITVSPTNDAPVAVNDAYTTTEDTPLTIVIANSVLTNDNDIDANPLTAVLVTGPTQGTLTLNADGTFTYTPTANYNGSDAFTYRANDGTANSNIATVTITINAVNDLPVAVNNAYATNEDTPLTVVVANSVLVNDTDTEGNALTAVLDAGPANGTLTLNANGTFTYTAAANYNGSDTFTYHANDGTGNSNIATVTITINAVNDAPVAVNDAYTTSEDTPLTVALANRTLLNDTDVEGGALTAVLDAGPSNGTLTFNSNGTFTYTPAANYNGSDTFTYHANDGTGNSNIATVTITVSPVNDAPVAVNDAYTTNEDTPLIVVLANRVLLNDTDAEGNALSAVLDAGPSNGTLTLNANGTFNYTPATNYNGSDSFTYHANDGTGNSNIATVTITINAVNDAPVAVNDTYTTSEDTPLTVALANRTLLNDTDVEGSTLTAVLDAGPSNGTLTFNSNGTFTYTPAANYNGSDSFTYHANDGTGNSNIATVTIMVSPANDAPVAVNDAYTTTEDTPLNVTLPGTVLANDTDADTNPLTAILVTGPANGTLTLNANGTFTYTPTVNYNGTDNFTYRANDGTINSATTATVTLTITPVNDAPVAVNNAYATMESTVLAVTLANSVLVNDTDVEGNTLTAVLNVGPTNGTLTLNANGTFTYTPTPGYNGTDAFTYHANDGTANSNIATVTITINAVNDAPVAVNDTYTTNEDTPLVVTLPATILSNDTDIDGNPLTALLDAGPSQGTLTLNSNGTFTYTPAANYNGSDSFTYHSNDGMANSNIATVTITINAINDVPVAVNNAYTTNEDTPLTVVLANSVLVNDTDVEGSTLTAVLDVGPSNGTLTLNANGTFTYTPAANYNGSDTFTYHANDGSGNSNIAMVTITVSPVNDTPVAVNNAYTTNEDTPLTVVLANSVLVNDTDTEGNALTAILNAGPANGTLTLNANGTFTYTPAANFNGSDSFTYHANDGTGNSNIATVTITINAINDVPVAVNDVYTTTEDTPLIVVLANRVLVNDTDVEGSALTAVLDAGPSSGTLTLNANGTFTYTPAVNYNGSDTFTYHANDGTGNSNIATVTITINAINDVPVAVNDTYTTNEDTPLTVALANRVLLNDTDAEGNTLTAVIDAGPSNGTLTLNSDGTFTYTPVANYNGGDSFTYHANDGTGNSNIATVTITINAVNDAPVGVNNAYTTNEDTPLTVVLANSVLMNDTDTEGNALTAILDVGPANGTLTLNTNGTFTYSPVTNFNGSDSFTYHANDGIGNSNIATVTITINSVNDVPTASNDIASTIEDTPVSINILANDSDVEAGIDLGSIVIIVPPVHGTITINNTTGVVTYTPDANYQGSDSFTYSFEDVDNSVSNSGSVSLTITPANDAPAATADTYTVNEDLILTVPANGVLTNDTDSDGDGITAALVTSTTSGTVVLNLNGSFTYTPNANFNGTDAFTYAANDGTVNSSTVTVTITVNQVNDAPISSNDAVTTLEDMPVTIAVLANDTDIDNAPLASSVVITTPPANGTVIVNPTTGQVAYTPSPDFNGSDSFSYTVNDPDGGTSNVATVNITITPVDDAPVATNDNGNTLENTPITISLLPNDQSQYNNIDPSSVTIVSNVGNGTLTIDATTGVVTYTPATTFLGSDTFTYTIRDLNGNISNVATVTINVTPVNDPPVAVDDGPITHNTILPITIDVLANDSDPDNALADLTIVSVTTPALGSVSIESGMIVYQPSGTTSGTATFTYTIQDPGGLTSTGTVTIFYEYAPLEVSQGFSPNNSGGNETWYIRSIGSYPENSIRVFDRWGILVFEATHYDNYSVLWDGRANTGMLSGKNLDQGTYYYVINLGNEAKELTGYVMIVR